MEYTIRYRLRSGAAGEFTFQDDLPAPGAPPAERSDGRVLLRLQGDPREEALWELTLRPLDREDPPVFTAHRLTLSLGNFSQVIAPDTGRSYTETPHPVEFWGFEEASSVRNIRLPLFLFANQQRAAGCAFGVGGGLGETTFHCLEPFQGRALSAYTRRLCLEIRRGGGAAGLPASCFDREGGLRERLFFYHDPAEEGTPWLELLRRFAEAERRAGGFSYPFREESLDPLWCSWTDWHSDHVDEALILAQAEEGLRLGIPNYIIDDGWFGPGLDSDREVSLNIGDWEPDPGKIGDLKGLCGKIREKGGRPLIWCAPHAVGASARCRPEREPLLVRNAGGEAVSTTNGFEILCVRSPEARRVMKGICLRLALDYDSDGAKYDLFNCIPDQECCSGDHSHDTDSQIEGLERLLRDVWEGLQEARPGYLVELKQNYGTPGLARYGTMMRAGDTPYSPEGNFWRTAYVQGYTPYAVNDYQTISPADPVEASAGMIIQMMAVGIPSYSMDMAALREDQRACLAFYNNWYLANRHLARHFRWVQDPDHSVWEMGEPREKALFLVRSARTAQVDRGVGILFNGASPEPIFLVNREDFPLRARAFRWDGGEAGEELTLPPLAAAAVRIPLGGGLRFSLP